MAMNLKTLSIQLKNQSHSSSYFSFLFFHFFLDLKLEKKNNKPQVHNKFFIWSPKQNVAKLICSSLDQKLDGAYLNSLIGYIFGTPPIFLKCYCAQSSELWKWKPNRTYLRDVMLGHLSKTLNANKKNVLKKKRNKRTKM